MSRVPSYPIPNILNVVIFAAVSLLTLLLTALVLPYKLIIYLLIKWKHGDDFHSMMDGTESLFSMKENSINLSTLVVFSPEGEPFAGICDQKYELLIENLFAMENIMPKAFCHRRYFMGYHYFLKGKPHEDMIQLLPDYENLEDVRRLVSQYANTPIGKDDDRLIRYFMGMKPINFEGKQCCVCIILIHHSLGDLLTLMNMMVSFDKENAVQKIEYMYESFKGQKEKAANFSRIDCFTLIKRIWHMKIYTPPLMRTKEKSILHGKALTGVKHCVWLGSNEDCTLKIRKIKQRIGNVSFSNVLLSALGASLSEYFQKHSHHDKIPDFVTQAMVVRPAVPELSEIVKIQNGNIEEICLTNRFTVCLVNIPIIKETQIEEHIMQSVFDLQDELIDSAESLDIFINWLTLRYLIQWWPMPLIGKLLHNLESTMITSCFPVALNVNFYGFVPNYKKTGLSFGLFSSGEGRLRLSLNADKSIIDKAEDAQEILNNIIKYIDVLDRKSEEYANKK